MGIQPIDLQVMYSQSSNVAKLTGGQQQAAQLSESMQQQKTIQQNIENATRVHEASNDKSSSKAVSDEGGGNGAFPGQSRGEKKDSSENSEQTPPRYGNIKESYLGTIIDITR